MKKLLTSIIVTLGLCVALNPLYAEKYTPKKVLGDGKDGRVFANYEQAINAKPVKEIHAIAEQVSGGADTYINVRFGDGNTLENGRRIPIVGKKSRVKWTVGGVSANGKPMVIKAYNGEVRLIWVEIIHQN
jgi:hypothetical protein